MSLRSTANQMSLASIPRSDDQIRRLFHELHSMLRDEGKNPIEAVSILATAIVRPESIFTSMLSERSQSELSRMISGASSGDISIAFQQFISRESRNGLGQYLTPLPVADFLADLLSVHRPGSV